jgi:hypothetical protein
VGQCSMALAEKADRVVGMLCWESGWCSGFEETGFKNQRQWHRADLHSQVKAVFEPSPPLPEVGELVGVEIC